MEALRDRLSEKIAKAKASLMDRIAKLVHELVVVELAEQRARERPPGGVEEGFCTVSKAAAIVGVDRAHLWRLTAAGRGPTPVSTRPMVFRVADVEAWHLKRKKKSAAAVKRSPKLSGVVAAGKSGGRDRVRA